MTEGPDPFDPWAILQALERHRVSYVLIGALAGVLHGTDEIADAVEICPQMKPQNVERLQAALAELDGHVSRRRTLDLNVDELREAGSTQIVTSAGDVSVVPQPPGSQGWDDVRRASTREPLGRGLRATVASVDDLARLTTPHGRRADLGRLAVLRRLAELNRGAGGGLGL